VRSLIEKCCYNIMIHHRYFGNYQCRDGMCRGKGCKNIAPAERGKPAWDKDKLVAGSVKAVAEYGFDSLKLDSGFPITQNLSLWAELLNKTGRPVMIEVRAYTVVCLLHVPLNKS
jgi:hypothetical protein